MNENVRSWLRDLFDYEIEITQPTLDGLKDDIKDCEDPVEKASKAKSISELEEFLLWINKFKKQTEEA